MRFVKEAIAITAVIVGLACAAGECSAVTNYHALLIACDDYVRDNDQMRDALRNFNCWRNGTITLLDDVMPEDITTKIEDWARQVDGDDVAFFYFSGHGGPVGAAGFDADGDETERNPPPDNDKVMDKLGRSRLVEASIGKTGQAGWKYGLSTDDEVKRALATSLPAGATLIAVFDMCHADEMCWGTADPDSRPNTAILNSIPEGKGNPDSELTYWLARSLYDLDGSDSPDADFYPIDGLVSVYEWFTLARNNYSRTALVCSNLTEESDRPFAKDFLGNATDIPSGYTDAGAKGYDGCGVCSAPDFGDAPDHMMCLGPTGVHERFYQSDLSGVQDPPRYNEWRFQWLGPAVDDESITDSNPYSPTCGADGDGADDADGVAFDAGNNRIAVFVTVTDPREFCYRLDAWWDLNDDGVFEMSPEEHAINSLVTYNGVGGGSLEDLSGFADGPRTWSFEYTLPFNPSAYFSRFRLTFGIGDEVEILPFGEFAANDEASHGEVEDYGPEIAVPCEATTWGRIKAGYP